VRRVFRYSVGWMLAAFVSDQEPNWCLFLSDELLWLVVLETSDRTRVNKCEEGAKSIYIRRERIT